MKQLLFIAVSALLFTSCKRVNPTEAGFKISLSGDYRGVDSLPLLTGYNAFMPFSSKIITIPTTQQHTVWTEDAKEGSEANQEITVSCMGGAGFKMDVGLNWRVNLYMASKIYLKYNTDDLESISQTYLRNVVRGTMQEISGTMTVDSLLNSLPAFEAQVHSSLNTKLNKEGFVIDLYNVLTQPRPNDKELAASINQKIKAKQDAERTKMELQSSLAEANKKIAVARGDSASAVIEAAGASEAIKLKQSVLTPEYIDYIRASNWNGALPSTMLGSGANTMFNIKP
jgi:regulator of protease activity HflC (stomatin/prohibitin superfamily)